MENFFCFWGLVLSIGATAQQSSFSAPAHFRDLHTVYTYQKSNWDGSHASTIFLYVADTNQLQSFKWNKGDERATLVTAFFDWNRLAVQKFQNHQLDSDGNRRLLAQLQVTAPRKVVLTLASFSDSMTLDSDHWHSYDFDFASLGFSWRAHSDKKQAFSFLVADVAMVGGKPAFVNKGPVQVEYRDEEMVRDKRCFLYKIDGPGLENRGGLIWIDPGTCMIEQYRIDLPDEEGFVNGQLQLLQTEKMTPQAWDLFIRQKIKEN